MRTYSGRSIVDSGRRRILEPSDTTVIFCRAPLVFKRYSSDFFDESKCTRFNFLAYISGSTDTKPIWICFFTSPRYNRSSIPWMYLDGLLMRSVSIRPCTNWCSACEPIPLEHSANNTATPPFFTAAYVDHIECNACERVWLLDDFPVLTTRAPVCCVSILDAGSNFLLICDVFEGCPISTLLPVRLR